MRKFLKLNALNLSDGTYKLKNITANNIGCDVEITNSQTGSAKITLVININSGAEIIDENAITVPDNFYFELAGVGSTKNEMGINLIENILSPNVSMQNTKMNLNFTFDGKAGGTIDDTIHRQSIKQLFHISSSEETKR